MSKNREGKKAAEARRASTNMRHLLVEYKSRLEDSLRAEGLTLAQLRLLNAVKSQSGVSAAALARTCFVTPQTLQAVLTDARAPGLRLLEWSLDPLGLSGRRGRR